MRLKLIAAFIFILPWQAPQTAGSADGLVPVEHFGTNPGNLAMWHYAPLVEPAEPAALVVALHGCTGSARQFSGAGFNELAERFHFFVLYPEQRTENHAQNCFNHLLPNDVKRGRREMQSIMQMVHYMTVKYDIDKSRIYLTGFSSGGQMANILAATYPAEFRAAAIIGAGGYVCEKGHNGIPGFVQCPGAKTVKKKIRPKKTTRWPRVSIWHGIDDRNVPYDTMLLAVTQWKRVHGLMHHEATPVVMPDDITYEAYRTASGKVLIESYTMNRHAHVIPFKPGCGSGGAWFMKAEVCFAREVVRFFGFR